MGAFLENITINMLMTAVTAIVIPVFVAWLTVYMTVKHERRQLLNEVRRGVYMDALRKLTKIKENPTIIFDETFFEAIKDVNLQIEVYADSKIQKESQILWTNISNLHKEFIEKFYSGEDADTRELYKQHPFFSETLEREEFDYKIQNMPDYTKVETMVGQMKTAITECLRKG